MIVPSSFAHVFVRSLI